MEQKHSKIGASTCERLWNCPGSVRLVATIPPQPPSEYAAEGTAAHELAEKCLKTDSNASDFIGQNAENGIEWTDEMAEHVQVYIDEVRQQAEGADLVEIEKKFHLREIDPDAFGTNDVNIQFFLRRLIVEDFKYGKGKAVEVEGNKQLLYYALGALLQGDYDEIEIVIVQPRAQHRDGPIRRWVISRQELEEFAVELKQKIKATKDPKAPLIDGPWCHSTFCPAIAVCPKVRKNIETAASVVFDDVKEISPIPADKLTPLQLRRVLDAVPLIDAWLKSVEAHALALAMKGEYIPDYKLVKKRAIRKWRDELEVIAKLGHLNIYEKKLLSPAKLEKIAGKEEVKPLTITPDTGVVLVHVDDPREEVSAQLAHTVFDEIN